MKKKKINEGLRNISRNFINEQEIEETLKNEIANELRHNKRKS